MTKKQPKKFTVEVRSTTNLPTYHLPVPTHRLVSTTRPHTRAILDTHMLTHMHTTISP